MWKAGRSISEILTAMRAPPGSIFSILLPFGGYYQPTRRRNAIALTLSEREEISRGWSAHESYRSMTRRLHRTASTMSREVGPNRGAAQYRAINADDCTWRRAKRPKSCHVAQHPTLRAYVGD